MSKMPGDGSIADFESGLIHRDDGEPAQVLKYGTRRRYAFGIHCDTGHAVERLVGRTEYWHRGPPCHAPYDGQHQRNWKAVASPCWLASRSYSHSRHIC